ncbi:MAG TPA: hypothetical protein VHA78_04810 [Candidatus Peribacteraceae bacterium]|nr:hypothetical protein [Candidatus Peribacteraceae bacterium]
MPDDAASPQSNIRLVIPQSTQEQFPELIALILHSESMNEEERQYWIDILPDMKEEQRTQLRDILVSERDQLADIDKKFALSRQETINTEQISEQRMQRAKLRAEKEDAVRQQEEAAAQQVLEEMD